MAGYNWSTYKNDGLVTVDYLVDIKKAKTKEELLSVLFDIYKKHKVTPGDAAFIFARVLFPEEIFKDIHATRDAVSAMCFWDHLRKYNQENEKGQMTCDFCDE